MNVQTLHDRVLVKPLEQLEKTAGGILIPDTAKEKPMEGEVISVGKGAFDASGNRMQMEVKVGDKVLYGKWAGTEVKLDGQQYLIMKESDILAIVNK